MKKVLLFAALLGFGFLIAGCNKNDLKTTDGEGPGVINVSIKSEVATTGRAVGTPTQTQENTVHSFTVYVFNYSTGVLEKSQTFTGVTQGQITGLKTAFTKRVVVAVNSPTLSTINSYADLQGALINLDSQVPGDFTATGLFMSGEYGSAVTLNASTPTPITVEVARLVAKVKLGTLTIDPELPFTLHDFAMQGVGIQIARSHACALGAFAVAPTFSYVGGMLGSVSLTTKTYLYESYSLPTGYVSGTPLTPNIYFYVFPNNNDTGKATTFTLRGTYELVAGTPVTMYYTFQVNDKVNTSGGSTTDGTWIERNKIYTLNVTLKKLGLGAGDPDATNDEAILDVTVEVTDWEGELIQNVEW